MKTQVHTMVYHTELKHYFLAMCKTDMSKCSYNVLAIGTNRNGSYWPLRERKTYNPKPQEVHMCEHGKGGAVPEFSENKISSVEDFNTVAPQIDQKVGVNAEGQYAWLIECNHGLPVYDLSKYRPLLEDIELTDAQASELLQIMWNIMTHFVDLGLNVDAISLLEADGGEGRSAEEKVDGPGQQQSGCGQEAKDSGAKAQDSVE